MAKEHYYSEFFSNIFSFTILPGTWYATVPGTWYYWYLVVVHLKRTFWLRLFTTKVNIFGLIKFSLKKQLSNLLPGTTQSGNN